MYNYACQPTVARRNVTDKNAQGQQKLEQKFRCTKV